jgi:hypothetical protein
MKFINAQNIKATAKSYGRQIHDKDLQVSADFVAQINDLVHAIVMTNVAKQDNLAGTLRATEWAHDRLQDANELLEGEVLGS